MPHLPVPVVDAWGRAAFVPLAALLIAIAAGALVYAVAIAFADRLRLSLVLAAMTCALLVALAMPVVFSADVYAYLAYGERLIAGCDPWGAACRSGPLAELARIAWHHDPPRLVYGPVFVVAAALVAPLAAISPGLPVLVWRIGMAIAFLVAVARIARILGVRAAIIVGVNPVALWTVAEGHNDALMLLAIAFALGSTTVRSGLWWIVATAIKGIAIVPALIVSWRKPRFALVILFASIACYVPLAVDLVRAGGVTASTTVAYDLASLLVWLPHPIAQGTIALLLAACLLTRCPRNERLATTVLIAWCLLPNAYPWYAIWILPIAGRFWGTSSASALVVAATCSIVRIIPDATIGNDPALRSTIVLMQFLPPLLTAAVGRLRMIRTKRATALAAIVLVALVASCAKSEPTTPPAPQSTAATAQAGQPTAPTTQFGYVVAPPAELNAAAGSPRILEIALNAQTLVSPGPVLVRVTTTPDVVSVIARALGREITIQQASPGIFSGGETIPRVPAFMRRSYDVEIVAATAAGKTAKASVAVTLR